LEFRHRGTWDFSGGETKSQAYADLISSLVDALVPQLVCGGAEEPWPMVESVASVLATTARLAGYSLTPGDTRPLFFDTGGETDLWHLSFRSNEWRDLSETLREQSRTLREMLMQLTGATKNSSPQVQMIDACRLLPVIDDLIKAPVPPISVPSKHDRWRPLRVAAKEIRERLAQAIESEHAHWREAYKTLKDAFAAGDGPLQIELSQEVEELLVAATTARSSGVFPGPLDADLRQQAQSMMKNVCPVLDRLLAHEETITEANTLGEKMRAVEDREVGAALMALAQFTQKWKGYLEQAVRAGKGQLAMYGSVDASDAKLQDEVVQLLADLRGITDTFQGEQDAV
jgi:hypothetical protein